MGWVDTHYDRDGNARYVARYRDIRGRKQTVGTFDDPDRAAAAASTAEEKVAEGRMNDQRLGRKKFKAYVEETWFPNHRLELRSRENYSYYLHKRIIPWFAKMSMVEIGPADVREFVTHLEKKEVPASSIEYCLTILSAIFTTALNDQIVFFHPCAGVSGPVVPTKVRKIITPEQFDTLYAALGEEKWQLLVETDIETGLRWGELTELRPKDLDSNVFTISRVVIELTSTFHPDGGRFLVKEYPKDAEHREVSISQQLDDKIRDFIGRNGIGTDDLIFAMEATPEKTPKMIAVPDPDTLGVKVIVTPRGKETAYKHGTTSCYVGAKCRCEHCRAAFTLYRRGKRAKERDRRGGRPRRAVTTDPDRHIPRSWFRVNVWLPARDAAKLVAGVKVHSLRHAHASWLLAGGADIARVKERLGHSSILTTQKYLHTLPDPENDAALDAFAKIRNRSKPSSPSAGGKGRSA
jgi:integrase